MTAHIRNRDQLGKDLSTGAPDSGLVVVVVACLLPYVTLGPLSTPSQIQPYAALLAWLWVGYRSLTTGVRISATQCFLLLFAVFFMINVYGEEGFDLTSYLRRSGAYLLSAGIFLACQYLTPSTLWRALKLAIPIWFAFGALRYIDQGTFYAVVTRLVPTVVVTSERGTSSLSPEATDFGFTMVFVVVLCMITRRRLSQLGIPTEKWPLLGAIACVLMSLSGTGYLGLAVVGAVYALTGPAVKFGQIGRTLLALVIVTISVMVMSLLPSQSIRGLELLRLAIQNPLALMDTTTAYRLVHSAVGVLSIPDSGFLGYGAGSFQSEALGVYYRHDLGNAFRLEGHYAENVPASLTSTPSSQVAIMLLEFGVIGVLYLIFIFGIAARSRIPLKALAITVMFLAWMGSFPASWPPFWILIGIMMSPSFISREREESQTPEPPDKSVVQQRKHRRTAVADTSRRPDSVPSRQDTNGV